jgi:cation transport protein ChaC
MSSVSDRPSLPLPALRPLSSEERNQSLSRTLADAPAGDAFWLFAYGSLIWSPCFTFEEKTAATLPGYRRAFNFWSVLTRGTPEHPGLGLGLEAGGECQGVAYRLSRRTQTEDLEAIWSREMFSAVYEARWLPLCIGGETRTGLCFVTNPAHEQYIGALPSERAAEIIAHARGAKGSCRDYLRDAVAALRRHGIADPLLDELLALVDGCPPAPMP